jgi:hypothetical protein
MKNKKLKICLMGILFLVVTPLFSQDMPADFGDIIDDNPTDATIFKFLWMCSLLVFTIVYLIRNKSFKKE